ncbi:class I SAM-dependent methyltransferase [Actinokineospora iranica]|uniref:S-adenosyl-L-methionine-dependent methyltransferase n=1 Tax=Actinokineospora iranica TaxID=1271860 RepID=A0A1G6U4B4_9PSEU|nr:class I SAM-dependent methyltransferase [Actinokineospora iranica]SDD36133.1 methyltransferase, TIGR00027 family [Actinokineospora iranica]
MSDKTAAVPDGVGMTAIGVAALRAQESARPDRWFDDPLAARFLTAAGWPQPPSDIAEAERQAPPNWLLLMRSVPVRTRFLDEFAHTAAAAGCRQVVLLGAGLDTRAFRLDWPPGTRVFELDLPVMLDFKRDVLADAGATPRCERIAVPADLVADWPAALAAAGLDTAVPTAWIAEGLLMYFTAAQNEELLGRIGALSAPGSRLALTVVSQNRLDKSKSSLEQGDTLGADVVRMWRSGAPEDPVAWLAEHGWRATVFDPAERAAAYGRPGLLDGLGREPGGGGLISAIRA